MSDLKFYGIGNAITDIYIPLSNSKSSIGFIEPLKKNQIIHISSSEMAALLLEYEQEEQIKISGGTAVNILKTASSLGAECTFSGTIGCEADNTRIKDETGIFFQRQLAINMIAGMLKTGTEPSGVFLKVIKPDESYAIACSPGAASQISEDQVLTDSITQADCIVLEGMGVENEKLFTLVRDLCRTSKKLLAIDIASPIAAKQIAKKLADPATLKDIDTIIFANEQEAENICAETGCDSLEELSARLLSSHKAPYPIIVHKLGKKGLSVCHKGNSEEYPEHTFKKTVTVKPKDETGAGDAFAGAFLYTWLSNKTLSVKERLTHSINTGNMAATAVLSTYGCDIKTSMNDIFSKESVIEASKK